MNRGIVVGTIYTNDGYPAKGAFAKIVWVAAGAGKMDIEKFEAKADKNGKYAAAFLWQGSGHADDLSATATIRLVAWTQEGDLLKDGYSRDTSHVARTTTGYLVKDILQPLNVATGNPFNSVDDLADFAIGIGTALINYKNLVPFWKISQVFSTEGFVIGAGQDLWLDNTN